MKCVILAAGEGIRMQPLTIGTHKSMLKLAGRPILEHILNDLPDSVDEVLIVVGYLREQIMGYFGNRFGKFKIDYVLQEEKSGTYDALKLCEDRLKDGENFLMLYADDLHGRGSLGRCAESDICAMLVFHADDPSKFGVVETGKDGIIIGIEEKPEIPKTDSVSTGVLLLNKEVFKYPARRHPNGEYYLTDSIAQMINAGYKFRAIESDFWLPIGFPEDLEKAEKILGSNK